MRIKEKRYIGLALNHKGPYGLPQEATKVCQLLNDKRGEKMLNQDEVVNVSRAMIRYGGSFVNSLGEALSHADPINQQKIKETWPEYWERYHRLHINDGNDIDGN